MAPEALDVVDVISDMSIHERVGVTDRMVLPETAQRLVTAGGVGAVCRPIPCAYGS